MSKINSFVKDDVMYYQLYMPCPNCMQDGRPTTPVYWHHEACGGNMYLGDNGMAYCEKCGETIPLVNCEFSCPECNPKSSMDCLVKRSELKCIAKAMTVVGAVATTGAGLKWLNRTVNAIGLQCEE